MPSGRLPFLLLSLSPVILLACAEETVLGKRNENRPIGSGVEVLTSCSKQTHDIPLKTAKALRFGPLLDVKGLQCDCNVLNGCLLANGQQIQSTPSGLWDNVNWRSTEGVADHDGVLSPDSNELLGPTFRRVIFARDDDSEDSHWSTVQLITPVIVGIAVAAIMLTLFVFYQRGSLSFAAVKATFREVGRFFTRVFLNCFGMRKVRQGRRANDWEIMAPETHGMATSPRSEGRSNGHTRLSSTTSDVPEHLDFSGYKQHSSEWVMPGKNLWKNSTLARKTRRLMLTVPLPWKKAIIPVKHTTRHRKFEIDASNKSTRTNSTLTNYRRAGFRTSALGSNTTESSGPSFSRHTDIQAPIPEEDEDSDASSDLGLGIRQFEDDDETEHLMTPNSEYDPEINSVMVIGDRNNTLESGDTIGSSNRIIPSSHGGTVAAQTFVESSTSKQPRVPPVPDPILSSSRAPPAPQHSVPVPPAPTYPAPAPPFVSPRSTPRSPPRQLREPPSVERILQQPLVNLIDYHSIPPPPPLPLVRSPPRSPSPQLPLPDIEPPTPLYTRRPPDARNPSESTPNHLSPQFALSSIPEVNGRLFASPSMESMANLPLQSLHQRSQSSTSSLAIPPITSPPYHSSPLPQEIRIARSDSPPPPITPLPGALLFSSVVSPPSGGGRPLPLPGASSPQPQHRRLLSADDSPANHFYSLHEPNASGSRVSFGDAYPTPRSHVRNFSSDSLSNQQQEHPAMMFPGPVRAAGYLQEGNMSSDSVYLRNGGRRGDYSGHGEGNDLLLLNVYFSLSNCLFAFIFFSNYISI
ncbi:hypothetical protein K435DRAFT_194691 [Dendrothele bispora CBS 962.96]|uniref:Autophagy-related protein 27 n=1 Tax=Dendrothele bispora (strain CBS 962.96) TaxID=1314807 RepID=A0A4S8LUQ8_DENBC|nr:hypothetical protein K435DRAFT_194691 [Dendrothele bispora CBS 962.96]